MNRALPLVVLASLLAAPAAADVGPAPLSTDVASRPLTLPRGVMALELSGGASEAPGFGATGVGALRYAQGVHRDLELAITPLALAVWPEPTVLQPGLDLTYRPIRGWAELALRVGVSYPAEAGGAGQLRVAAPMRFHVEDLVRVDVLVELATELGPRPRAFLRGPLVVTLQPHPLVFAGISGAIRTDLEDWSTIAVSAGAHVGATVPADDGRPLVDVAASFGFPTLVEPFGADQVVTERWFLGLSATGYLAY